MTHPDRPKRQSRGFTLLEMLTVLGIMGLIGGLAFPALDRSINAQAFRTATMQVERAVREAQANAIREHRTVAVATFRNDDARAAINVARRMFLSDLRIEQSSEIRFFRDGTSSGGTIRIRSGKRLFRIEINALTGVVTAGLA